MGLSLSKSARLLGSALNLPLAPEIVAVCGGRLKRALSAEGGSACGGDGLRPCVSLPASKFNEGRRGFREKVLFATFSFKEKVELRLRIPKFDFRSQRTHNKTLETYDHKSLRSYNGCQFHPPLLLPVNANRIPSPTTIPPAKRWLRLRRG